MKKIITICIVLCVSIGACNFKKAPKCDEESVKNTAINIVKKKIREQLNNGDKEHPFNVVELSKVLHSATEKIVGAKFPGSVDTMGLRSFRSGDGYNWSYKQTDEFKQYRAQVEDSLCNIMINDLMVNIRNIRTVGTNNEIKKCDCEADIYLEDYKIRSVSYSAQFTKDEKIYVTVSFE
jgi:hypothetical protein